MSARLQRARRARAGARADRLHERLGRQPRARSTSASIASTHDDGVKKVFGKRGRFDWRDACRLCLEHKKHPSFFVQKLWSYFIPTKPSARTAKALERLYVEGDYVVRPLVEAILRHPDLYRGPRMVKPPIVYIAGLLRGMGQGVDTESWVWLSRARRASSSSIRRTSRAGRTTAGSIPPPGAGAGSLRRTSPGRERCSNPSKDPPVPNETATMAVDRALAFWGNPTISRGTRRALERVRPALHRPAPTASGRRSTSRSGARTRLRMMIATSPDLQTC